MPANGLKKPDFVLATARAILLKLQPPPSRTRCSAETYSREAMMMAATSHMRIFELLMDEMAAAMESNVFCSTLELVYVVRPGVPRSGVPRMTTAVTKARPPRTKDWDWGTLT